LTQVIPVVLVLTCNLLELITQPTETLIIAVSFMGYSYLRLIYGDMTFTNIRLTGQYEVGFRSFVTMKGNWVAVYYPIEVDSVD
jgi:hypothetical protein